MIRFFVFLGSLLVIGLLAALFAPPFVDWNQYKTRFETEASRVLGLPVAVYGDTSVRLLPLPSVTFKDMKVGQTSDGVPLLKAESFTMNVELAPLLKGEVVIADVQLDKPVFDVRLDKSGNIEWPKIKTRARIDIDREDVALDNVGINGGVIRLRDERFDHEILVRNIDARASARTLTGPWRADGTLTYVNERARLRVSTGKWQASQSMSLKLFVEPQSQPYDLAFDGPLTITDGVPKITGILTAKPMSVQSNEDIIAFRRPDFNSALPIRLESDVALLASGAAFPAFKMTIGKSSDPYSLNGSADAQFGEVLLLRANAEGQQVDLKRFENNSTTLEETPKLGLSARLGVATEFLRKLPNMPINSNVSLFLPAVVAGDTVIRDVGVDLSPLEGGQGWQIGNLEAQLPGRTDLRADGKLSLGEDLNFSGDLVVASRQPSGLAKWLGVEASQTIRDLSGTGFSGKVDVSPSRFLADNLELNIDGKTLNGGLSFEVGSETESRLLVRLQGEEANIDQLDALAKLITNGKSINGLTAKNIDLELNALRAIVSGAVAKNVHAKLQRNSNSIKIEQLRIEDLAGAKVAMSGVVENLLDNPIGKISGKVVSQNPSKFLKLINTRLGGVPGLSRLANDPALTENTDLEFAIEGARNDTGLALSLTGKSGASDIDATVSGISSAQSLAASGQTFKLVLVNPEASQLMLQLGVPVVPLDQTGRAAFRISGNGSLKDGFKTESALTLKAGYVSAAGVLKPMTNGENVSIEGRLLVTGEVSDLDSAILMSGLPVPGYGDGGSAKFDSQLKIQGPTIEAENIRVQTSNQEILGRLVLRTDQLPRPILSGQLSSTNLDANALRLFVHTGDVDASSSVALKPLLAGLDGEISLTANSVVFGALPPLRDASATLKIRDGDMQFEELKAAWMGGILSGNSSISQSAKSGAISGGLKLIGADAKQLAAIAKLPPKLSGSVDVSFNYDASSPIRSEFMDILSGGGTIRMTGGAIDGLNSSAFGPILVSSDGIDDKSLAAAAGKIISDGVFRKSFAFDQNELTYTVANGAVRINSVELTDRKLKLSGKANYTLSNQAAEFEGRLTFAAGQEALAGAEPEIFVTAKGAADNLGVTVDTTFFQTYLGLRLSEHREREFLAQRAEILERQRLTRTARVYALREEAKRAAEAEKLRLEQLKQEEDRRRKTDEIKRLLEEEKKAQVEAEKALQQAAAQAKRQAEKQKQIDALRERANRASQRLQLNFEATPQQLDEVPADD